MKYIFSFSILFLAIVVRGKPLAPGSYSSPISKFAFGSCNKHDHPQPLWEHIFFSSINNNNNNNTNNEI